MTQKVTNLVAVNLEGRAKLADDSVWCIAPRDLPLAFNWPEGVGVSIEQTENIIWRYKLRNVENGVEVSVLPSQRKS